MNGTRRVRTHRLVFCPTWRRRVARYSRRIDRSATSEYGISLMFCRSLPRDAG